MSNDFAKYFTIYKMLIKSSFWYKSLAHKKTSNKKNKNLTFKMDT